MCGSGRRTGDEGSVAAGPQWAAVAMARARLGGGLGCPGHGAHLGALPAQEGGQTAVVQPPPAVGPPGSLVGHLHEVTRRAGLGVKGGRQPPLQAAPSQASAAALLPPASPLGSLRPRPGSDRQVGGRCRPLCFQHRTEGRLLGLSPQTTHGPEVEPWGRRFKENSQGGAGGEPPVPHPRAPSAGPRFESSPQQAVTGLSLPFLFGSWG